MKANPTNRFSASLLGVGLTVALVAPGCADAPTGPTAPIATAAVGLAAGEACGETAACDDGLMCRKAPGQCAAEGVCSPTLDVCPAVSNPVCGCDGADYDSACLALQAGVSVDHKGPCAPAACGSSAECGAGEYCRRKVGACGSEGVCADLPTVCPKNLAPVCGCDGQTYDNRCFATAAGVTVAALGACPAPTCTSNDDCGGGAFCRRPPGQCGGTGLCKAKPMKCAASELVVCGCDGSTYGSTCEAAMAGVTVDALGACKGADETCGGFAGFACSDPTDFCEQNAGECGIADGLGTCVSVPELCPAIFAPVCGCDGVTYSNDCVRRKAFAQKDTDGACCDGEPSCPPGTVGVDSNGDGCDDTCAPPCDDACDCYDSEAEFDEPCLALCPTCDNYWQCEAGVCAGMCGPTPPEVLACAEGDCESNVLACAEGDCESNEDCAGPLEYCAKDGCDGAGTCALKPEACAGVVDEVCGCDGETYSNSCVAAASGVNVGSDEACDPALGPGECLSSDDCGGGEYCKYELGDCGANPGVCEPTPFICPLLYLPVCGCDKATYGNDCEAATYGVSVLAEGECPPG